MRNWALITQYPHNYTPDAVFWFDTEDEARAFAERLETKEKSGESGYRKIMLAQMIEQLS